MPNCGYTLYKRQETGTWWVNFRQPGGKRIRRNTAVAYSGDGANPPDEARQRAATIWLAEGGSVASPEHADAAIASLPLSRLWAMFLEESISSRISGDNPYEMPYRDTYRTHAKTNAKVLEPLFPTLESFNDDHWRRVRVKMREDGGVRHKGLKLKSIAQILVTLRLFVAYLHSLGLIKVVPHLSSPNARAMKAQEAKRRAMTEAERDTFLAALQREDAEAHRAYVVLFYTAMRKGELEKVTPRWIDFRNKWITMPPMDTKTKDHDQCIGMHHRAEQAIAEQMAENKRTRDNGVTVLDAPIFGRINHRNLFWRVIDACGIDRTGLTAHHVTRHTCISQIIEKGGSPAAAKALSRHKTWVMVQRYTHLNAELSKEGLAKIL